MFKIHDKVKIKCIINTYKHSDYLSYIGLTGRILKIYSHDNHPFDNYPFIVMLENNLVRNFSEKELQLIRYSKLPGWF